MIVLDGEKNTVLLFKWGIILGKHLIIICRTVLLGVQTKKRPRQKHNFIYIDISNEKIINPNCLLVNCEQKTLQI